MTCRLRWWVEMETRCRIPIWRTFGRIQWHVIPEPRIILQGVATWWIHWHDSTAICHIAGCSHLTKSCHDRATLQGVRIPSSILKIVFHHILFFLFLIQFRVWRAAAFVSSPIHLFYCVTGRKRRVPGRTLQSMLIVFFQVDFVYCVTILCGLWIIAWMNRHIIPSGIYFTKHVVAENTTH